ncbi:hypothetical protein QFZ68_000006 [Streptomyces sp. V1I6]|nr:hypothetical protein [Streptomyces sp. V1I6]
MNFRASPEHEPPETLFDFVEDSLNRDARDRVLAHLATCAKCRAEADKQQRLKSLFHPTAPPPPTESFLARLQGLPGEFGQSFDRGTHQQGERASFQEPTGARMDDPFEQDPFEDDPFEDVLDEDVPEGFDEDDIAPAVDNVNHAMARLFLKLGPPPSLSEQDLAPVGGGDGGAQS